MNIAEFMFRGLAAQSAVDKILRWETPLEFCRRIGIRVNAFSRKVRRPECPLNFETLEGPTGRIVKLRSSPELEAFMRSDARHRAGRVEQKKIVAASTQRVSGYGKD